jgi:hypothetical protein
VHTYVVRVWVPDRPGALGQVASRIGAVRGDVIGIDILERGGGKAVDELVVTLPSDDLVPLLVTEIGEVDDVDVEEVRLVDATRPEAALVALEAAARLVETEPAKRIDRLCGEVLDLVEGEWACVVSLEAQETLVELGDCPSAGWLVAFVAGSRHLAPHDQHAAAPSDLAWSVLDGQGLAVAAGRVRSFRARERQQMALLARVASGLLAAGPIE